MNIGITEQGDAALDFNWTWQMKNLDGAIIISKGFNKKLEDELLKYKNKVIYHASCTGLGGTNIEPNIPIFTEKLNHITSLIHRGFDPSHIVIRIDPLMPKAWIEEINKVNNINYIQNIKDILVYAKKLNIKRIRWSYFDPYKHALDRFKKLNYQFANSDPYWIPDYNNEIQLDKLDFSFEYEVCSELYVPHYMMLGCISGKDVEILKLNKFNYKPIGKHQRPGCLCLSCKQELLNSPKQCAYGCAYCYWK